MILVVHGGKEKDVVIGLNIFTIGPYHHLIIPKTPSHNA